jgi:hypothetical protein
MVDSEKDIDGGIELFKTGSFELSAQGMSGDLQAVSSNQTWS